MSAFKWLAASLLFTALAQLGYKAFFKFHRWWWFAATILLFTMVPYATYHALQSIPLATVYVATTISQLLVVGASLLWLGERYSRLQWQGFVLVMAGVLIFNF